MYKSFYDALRATALICDATAKQAESAQSDVDQVLYLRDAYPEMIGALGRLLVELGKVKLVD